MHIMELQLIPDAAVASLVEIAQASEGHPNTVLARLHEEYMQWCHDCSHWPL